MTSVRARLDRNTRAAVRWGLGHLLPSTAMRLAERRGDLQAVLLHASRDSDPFPVFEQIRAHGSIYRGRFAFLTPSMPVVREVLTSNDFRAGFDPSSAVGGFAGLYRWATADERLGPLEPPSLLVTEPPDHTRYRKLGTRVFSVRAVERLRTRPAQIANELLDELDGRTDV